MIENLKRIREPLAWAVIAVVAANIGLGIGQLVLQLQQDVPVFEAFQEIGTSLMNMPVVLAVVVLVCTCFFIAPATPHALLVTRVAAWVLSIGVVLTAVCTLLGAAASAGTLAVVLEVVGVLLDLVLKALAAGALWVLLRGVHAGRIDTAPNALPAVEPPAPDPARDVRTTWQRGEATGAVWRTAEDAASGAPGAARMPEPGAAGSPGPSREPGPAGLIFRDEQDDHPGHPGE